MKFKFKIGDILESDYTLGNRPLWIVIGFNKEMYKLRSYNWKDEEIVRKFRKQIVEKGLRLSIKTMKLNQWNQELQEILKA